MHLLYVAIAVAAVRPSPRGDQHDIVGTVTDSAFGKPLPGTDILLRKGTAVVARTSTDAFGSYILHNISDGSYQLEARFIGFRAERRALQVAGAAHDITVSFRLVAAPLQLQELEITASVPIAVDTRSGDQVFKQEEFHGAPTITTSQVLQQSISGAARAPTGEVHIRGQHAEYTYYVDGVPVPAGISGSLNELFDPSVTSQINFQTGAWDAEYGNKNAAVVNVATKVPAGGFHATVSGYGGSFSSNGQTASASTNAGKFGLFVSGSRTVTDMRREPVMADVDSTTATVRSVTNFHNHGEDLFAFGKLQFVPTDQDLINLVTNWSQTTFGVPFDSTGGVLLDDTQRDVNSFVNLGWNHRTKSGSELFVGGFHRRGSLRYTPGSIDTPQFIFFPDTLTPYNLREDRNFNTTGIKLDYQLKASEAVSFKIGTLASLTRGHEDFATVDVHGNPGPASDSDLQGSDIGVYAQTTIAPSEKWEIRTGIRYDNHDAPFAGPRDQVSPRIRVSIFPNPSNTIWFYYGRLFMPTNVEDLRAITSVAQGGVAALPTLPERDDFYEVGYVHRFPLGIVTKLSAYHKASSPGIDDNTVPGSAITTSVNIDEVKITGVEAVVEIRPGGSFSGYVNAALNHAYGRGPVTGGFFPTANPPGYFDLDHDQRLSLVGNVNFAARRAFASLTGIYGSGLTNGNAPDPATYGTGLFDFNRDIKVDPSFILNASAGYTIPAGTVVLRPQVYIDNVLDHQYLLKGAFFSGASYSRPRSVQVRMAIGI